jgi:eukaryotic-like serine/threonine-protein kinase
MRWIFTVTTGLETGRSFDRSGDDVVIVGCSAAHLDLGAADKYVSGVHCAIEVHGRACVVRDLGSTNGTFVNGRRVESADLRPGDEIRVGRTTLRVSAVENGGAEIPSDWSCVRCRKPVEGLGDGSLDAFVCAECRARELDAHDRTRELWVGATCRDCGAEVSTANHDGKAFELGPIAWYMCEACEERRVAEYGGSAPEIGGYRCLWKVGAGGFGEVWMARGLATGRLVALKTVLPSVVTSDERVARWFRREMAVARELVHPNVARWYDGGEHRSMLYFAAEYVDGGDLERAILRRFDGPLPTKLAASFALQALDALDHAHAKGFVHRDVKPSNLLLTTGRGGLETVKIGDFGLAKSFLGAGASLLTEAGEMRGTPYYMAKEQFADFRYVGPSVDVYAIGITLYFMLSGAVPFDYPSAWERHRAGGGESRRLGELIRMILEEDRIPIREKAPHVPEALAVVVDVAVGRELSDRFETAAGFREALLRASRVI